MSFNLDYWILRINDTTNNVYNNLLETYYNPFTENKRVEYLKIPSNVSYNQIFKLLFLISSIYDDNFEKGDLFIEELTSKQVAHILNRIFNYEIITKENINEKNQVNNNRIKNIVLFYFKIDKYSLLGEDISIDKFLDKGKYLYDRLNIKHSYKKDDKENELLLFRDENRIKLELKYVIDNKIDDYENVIFNRKLKKNIRCIYKNRIKSEDSHIYIVLNDNEIEILEEKIMYINILHDNFYRKKVTMNGLIKYPSYNPVNGKNMLTAKEMAYFLNKIYSYRILNENEVKILNKNISEKYNNGHHEGVFECHTGNSKGNYNYLKNRDQNNYARPNVSRIILQRQIDLASGEKKEYYIKKLSKIEKKESPEYLILSALEDYY